MRTLILAATALLAGTPATAQHWLSTARVFDPAAGRFAGVRDVDLDGNADLIRIASSPAGGSFTVLTNMGAGELAAGPAHPLPPIGSSDTIALEDITGDGRPDAVLVRRGLPSASGGLTAALVHPGLPGGLFGPALTTPLGASSVFVGAADINGDSRMDLAFIGQNGSVQTISWFLGGASGLLVPGPSIPEFAPLLAACLLDVDQDGLADIVAAVTVSASPALWIYRTTAAGITFLGVLPLGSGLASPASLHLHAADVDADNRPDLIHSGTTSTYPTSFVVTVVRRLAGGALAVQPEQPFPIATVNALRVAPCDWDGDGDADLMTRPDYGNTNPATMALYANSGTGIFSPAFSVRTGGVQSVRHLDSADLDGDGFDDAIGGNEILFSEGTIAAPVTPIGSFDGVASDFDDDGDRDLLKIQPGILANDGRASFQSVPLPFPPLPPYLIYSIPFYMLPADLDGNGRPEYLAELRGTLPAAFFEMRRLEVVPSGALVDAGPAAVAGVNLSGATFIDADGDGDLDALRGNGSTYLNSGFGFFGAGAPLPAGWVPRASGDVDGDSDIDVVAIDVTPAPGPTPFALFRNQGGSLALEPLVSGNSGFAFVPYLGWPLALIADLDDDGDPDIAVDDLGSADDLTLFRNTGGNFAVALHLVFPGTASGTLPGAFATDIDGDGATDLVLPQENLLRVLRRAGSGLAYEPSRDFAAPSSRFHAGDLDGDGDLDFPCDLGVVMNRARSAGAWGSRRQYGAGSPGSGGFAPVLGVGGFLRPGFPVDLRLRAAVGGGAALLVVGSSETAFASFPAPGLTTWVQNWLGWLGLQIVGSAAPGEGRATIPVVVPASLSGQALFWQAACADPAGPSGLTVSNGLETRIGL